MGLICSDECEKCINCTLDESNRAKVKVICSAKEKEYYYGQYVNCDDFSKKPIENGEEK